MTAKPVVIADYTNEWAEQFEVLKSVLQRQLGYSIMAIEHVGSTSVPGLAAKPIIDIDVVIESRDFLPEVISKLSELGYYHEGDLGVAGREAFGRKDEAVPYDDGYRYTIPEHHLYVCDRNSDELRRHLAFRDILRGNAALAKQYGELKRDLAKRFRFDRQAYTTGKTEFVTSILKEHGGLNHPNSQKDGSE